MLGNIVAGGLNADLILHVQQLYPLSGKTVADVTFNRGMFWRKTDTSAFTLLKSDLVPMADDVAVSDCRALPYEDASTDVVVLDPPYLRGYGSASRKHWTDASYNTASTVAGMTNQQIIDDLYAPAMKEASRVLRPGGQLWVKGKNQTDRKQSWNDVLLYQVAVDLGFYGRDKFLYIPRNGAPPLTGRQRHARHSESFLWIFDWLSAQARAGR